MYARDFIRGMIDGASKAKEVTTMQAGATLALAMLEYNKQYRKDLVLTGEINTFDNLKKKKVMK